MPNIFCHEGNTDKTTRHYYTLITTKSQHRQILEGMKNDWTHPLLVQMQILTTTLGKSLTFLSELEIPQQYDSILPNLDIYSEELKTCQHKNQHVNIYSSSTWNCQTLKRSKISSSRCIQTMECYWETTTTQNKKWTPNPWKHKGNFKAHC